MARKRRERIYLVPRWSGLAFSVVLLLIFALGFAVPPVREFTQPLGIALLVVGVVILIQTNENLRGVEITASHAVPTAAGDSVWLEVTLRNAAESERVGLEVRQGLRWRTAWRARAATHPSLPGLDSQQSATIRLPIATTRRGCYPMPDLWVGSILPVGLCFAWKVFRGSGDYIVYPRPRGRSLDHVAGRGRHVGSGLSGGNEDVSGHRPYQAGDPLSRLDWRVYARTGEAMIRTLEDGSGGEVTLRWEDTYFLQNDEARLEQLSYWIDQCIREARLFRLDLPHAGGDLNSRNVAACREALATYRGNIP